jgi:transposase
MQMQLPIFPSTTKLINSNVGLFEKDGFVYYLHNGSPIFCHDKNDLNNYRYILANMVVSRLCSPMELAKVLGISNRNIQRYAKTLREKGTEWFFHKEGKKGDAHKLTEDLLKEAQSMLDRHEPVLRIARQLGVTEGALRYHLRQGSIKKK